MTRKSDHPSSFHPPLVIILCFLETRHAALAGVFLDFEGARCHLREHVPITKENARRVSLTGLRRDNNTDFKSLMTIIIVLKSCAFAFFRIYFYWGSHGLMTLCDIKWHIYNDTFIIWYLYTRQSPAPKDQVPSVTRPAVRMCDAMLLGRKKKKVKYCHLQRHGWSSRVLCWVT